MPLFRLIYARDHNQFITAVIPGDYNADGNLDVLIVYQHLTGSKTSKELAPTNMRIYLGDTTKFSKYFV